VANIQGTLTVGTKAIQLISADAATDGFDRITVDGKSTDGALHLGGGSATAVMVDSPLIYNGSEVATTSQLMSEQLRAQNAEKNLNNQLANRTAVAEASLVNIVASELTPEEFVNKNIHLTGIVAQTAAGEQQLRVGVSKTYSNGVNIGGSLGTTDKSLGLNASKMVDINPYLHIGLIGELDNTSAKVGPTASLTNNSGKYGVGLSTLGTTVIVNGVTVPVGP
jgi:hypothetical protein